MSISHAARGKRPTRQDEALHAPPVPSILTNPASVVPATPNEPFRRRRHSATLLSPSLGSQDGELVGTAALEGLHPIWRTGATLGTPGLSFLSPLAGRPAKTPPATLSPGMILSEISDSRPNRPRSMYELHVTPPDYYVAYDRPGLTQGQRVFAREEEGKEHLPEYSCQIHLEGYFVSFLLPFSHAGFSSLT